MQLPLTIRVGAVGKPIKLPITTANQKAIFVYDCDDGVQRLCKGGTENSFAPANEWVCSMLARAAGFPVLDPAIVNVSGVLFFGTPFVKNANGYFNLSGPSDAHFRGASNSANICYEATAFDALVANPDRHIGNLIVVRTPPSRDWIAYLHDHDRALFGCPGRMNPAGRARLAHFNADWLDGWARYHTAWIRDDNPWHTMITDWAEFLAAVDRVQRIPARSIRDIVEQIPDEWIDASERPLLFRFLLKRKAKLGGVVAHRRSVFP